MKTEIITSLKELSKIINENKEELYNIDARGITEGYSPQTASQL